MATLRRGLVDTVKKAASKVSTRGVQVAAKAGTKGARVLVETTVAAVKTVDKLQEKLGRRAGKASFTEKAVASEAPERAPTPKKEAKAEMPAAKPRRASSPQRAETLPVEQRDMGRKTVPAASTAPKSAKKGKRGQKHRHSGR